MTSSTCPPLVDRVTKSLLGYGIIAGPIYVVVVAAQQLTRAGFDPTRHEASLLVNGGLGWIQITNFILTGMMVMAAGFGVVRALGSHRSAVWGGGLIFGFGIGLLAAGVFRADPSLGFPPGTAPGRGGVSWHGVAHLVAASIGFACLIAACFVLAARFNRDGQRPWAWYSVLTGALFAVGFTAVASGSTSPVVMLTFTASVVLAWAWLTAISLKLYKEV